MTGVAAFTILATNSTPRYPVLWHLWLQALHTNHVAFLLLMTVQVLTPEMVAWHSRVPHKLTMLQVLDLDINLIQLCSPNLCYAQCLCLEHCGPLLSLHHF